MHGAGNDVIVFEAPGDGRLPTPARWRELSDRHKGIGFDQAMVLAKLPTGFLQELQIARIIHVAETVGESVLEEVGSVEQAGENLAGLPA
jgi:hypothetical protein